MTKTLLFGILTPVVTMVPSTHESWELDGSIEDIATVVKAAERFGYYHVTCSEHVVIPDAVAAVRGSRYWDPLSVFGYLSAVTTHIKFTTNVLVLGYHHPLEIAKRYGTLDQVSHGRLILGLGVGTLKEEFDLLGVPFEDRGARADEALRALRSSLSQSRPAFEGSYYRYSDLVVDPCSAQERVPLWIGGKTARSLRRAVELGDGWTPSQLDADQLTALIAKAKQTPAWEAREEPLEVVLSNSRRVDPQGDPDAARSITEKLLAAGATALQLSFVHHSVEHYVEQLEAMSTLLRPYVDSR